MLFDAEKRLINPYNYTTMFKFRKGSWQAGLNIKSFQAEKTTNSGGNTETITGLIPAGCILLGVVGKVTTILAGAGLTTWSAGITGNTDFFGTTLAKTAGTTFGMTTVGAHTGVLVYPAAVDVLFTAAAGVFTTGVVKVVGFYIDLDALTSSP